MLLNFSEDDIRCDGLTHGQYLAVERLLAEAVPRASVRSSEAQLGRVRAVKTPEELRRLQQAIDRTITLYDRLLPTLHAGQTERQIQTRMNALAAELGTTPDLGDFGGPLVLINRVGMSHRAPTDAAVEPGDLLILDTALETEGLLLRYCPHDLFPQRRRTRSPRTRTAGLPGDIRRDRRRLRGAETRGCGPSG